MITYPRSGANYLQNLLLNKTGELVTYSHTIDLINSDNSVIISIARDPFDSIHSHVTMKKHYYPDQLFNKSYTDQYKDIYDFSYENAEIIIDYNDLIKSPQEVLEKVCSILGLAEQAGDKPMQTLADNKKFDYLVTSRISSLYKEKHFEIEDIQDCYDPYKKLLSKAINFTRI